MKRKKGMKRDKGMQMLLWIMLTVLFTGCGKTQKEQETWKTIKAADEATADKTTADMEGSLIDAKKETADIAAKQTDLSERETERIETKEDTKEGITLCMVGDILLHTPVAESAKTQDGYDFYAIFEHTRDLIGQADVSLVNEEVIIGGETLGISGYPAFNAPFSLADALVDTGFDVVLHATNHALDKGKKGLLNCMDNWKNYKDIAVLGIHESKEDADEIYIYEQNGIKIAILNYTYGTNGIALPEDMPYGVDYLEKKKVKEDLIKAETLADFTVVCPHWGTEYALVSSKEQEEWAEYMASYGADLIIGTHPHVIEPIRYVGDTLVYYSLGNFVNWTSGTGEHVSDRMVGAMAQVTIEKEEDEEAYIASWGVVPLVCHVESGTFGVSVYPLSEYTKELSEKNEIRKQDENFSLEYCETLVEKVFGEVLEQN